MNDNKDKSIYIVVIVDFGCWDDKLKDIDVIFEVLKVENK